MLARILGGRRERSEAERPFWISYADLMTAMMTLCLVVMAVTIIAISRELVKERSADQQRAEDIREICEQIEGGLKAQSGITVDCDDHRIDFGEAGRFAYKDYRLPPIANERLAVLVPAVLEAANGKLGKKWLKQVIIEGYTDTRGTYLYNLNLSLKRSYWVMCTLVDPRMNTSLGLTEAQVQGVRELFLAGGVSFNDAKESDEKSRRVELRLQFLTLAEQQETTGVSRPHIQTTRFDRCELR